MIEAQKRLGNRIKSLREGRSLTQRELAEHARLLALLHPLGRRQLSKA